MFAVVVEQIHKFAQVIKNYTQPGPETRKLRQLCCRLVTLHGHQAISGCVRIACSSLMITSLLQVVKRLDAS